MNRRKGPTSPADNAWPDWLLPAGIAFLTFLAFLPALRAGFVNWDDDKNFLTNPLYRGLGWTQLRWMFTTFYEGMYQPVFWLGAGLDYELWGMNAGGYHLINILLHGLNAVLFYFLSLRLLGSANPASINKNALRRAAAFAALLFSLHPLRVESVVWLTELKDVLSGVFYLGAVLWYADAAESGKGWRGIAGCLILYAAALLAKASGVGFPFVLLALDVYPLKRLPAAPKEWLSPRARPVLLEKLPFFALSLAAGLAGLASKQVAIVQVRRYSVAQRVAQALYGLVFYFAKTLAPLRLYPLHEFPAGFDPFAGVFLLDAMLVAAAVLLLYRLRTKVPGLLTAAVAYVVFLAPVLGLVKWNLVSVADRYTYLACGGWAILAGGAFLRIDSAEGRPKTFLRLGAAFLLAAYAGLTWQQTQRWRDSTSLWTYDLTLAPDVAMAQYDMASALFDSGRVEESIPHLEEALRLKPDYFDAIYNLGNAYYKLGRLAAAQKQFESAVKMRPEFSPAWNNLGNVFGDLGQHPQAIAAYDAAINHQPDYAEAYFNRGNALFKSNRLKEAIASYDEALRLKPDLSVAQRNKELALRALNQKGN